MRNMTDDIPTLEEMLNKYDEKAEDEIFGPATVAETADELGVSRRTVQLWVVKGYFPNAFPINPNAKRKEFRIPRADIRKFIAKRNG